jgi:hypothetical protein
MPALEHLYNKNQTLALKLHSTNHKLSPGRSRLPNHPRLPHDSLQPSESPNNLNTKRPSKLFDFPSSKRLPPAFFSASLLLSSLY